MQKNTKISERIAQVINFYGVNSNVFAKKLGYERSQSVYDILNGKANPSFLFFEKFVNSEYSEQININWLITGKGNMLKSDLSFSTNIQKQPPVLNNLVPIDRTIDNQKIPLYNIEASAGLIGKFYDDQHIIPEDYIMIPNMSRVDGAVYVRGDSMYPLLKSGDIILIKQVHNFDYISYGDVYLLAFSLCDEEYTCVKYVQKAQEKDHIKLVSHNTNHQDQIIPIKSIQAMAIVKASIRYNTMG